MGNASCLGRKPVLRVLVTLLGMSWGVALPSAGHAMPEGGQVVSGAASVQLAAGNRMNIQQNTPTLLMDWGSFSIGGRERVHFQQPSTASLAVNRVTGNNLSEIYGTLSANGTVVLANPHGVIFHQGSQTDVGSLVATTGWISKESFASGHLVFASPSDASVINRGRITVAQGGALLLAAPQVENAGVIQARLGRVNLAAGPAVTVDFDGDGRLSFAIPETTPLGRTLSAVNSGLIQADGGSVRLTAAAARDATQSVVRAGGAVEAHAVDYQDGKITLHADGGQTTVFGSLDVSGTGAHEKGGTIQVLGDRVNLQESARLNASGAAGGGSVAIGGGYQGKDTTLPNASRTAVVKGASVRADAIDNGAGGTVTVWADKATWFEGQLSARGGRFGGDGGFAEVSGNRLHFNGMADLSSGKGRAGTLLLDPRNLTITDGGADDLDAANGSDANTAVYAYLENEDGSDATISPTAVTNALLQGHVILQAHNDITVDALVSSASTTSNLTLQAGDDIFINKNVSLLGSGGLTLHAGNAGGGTATIDATKDGTGTMAVASGVTLSTATGDLAIATETGGSITLGSASLLSTQGGKITLSNGVTLLGDATIRSVGGDVTLSGVVAGDFALGIQAGTGTVNLSTVSAQQLTATAGTIVLNGDVTVASDLDLQSAVSAITLAGASQLDVTKGGNSAISLAPVSGDYALTLLGDAGGSALSLKSVSANSLSATGGVLTLNAASACPLSAAIMR
ncbi:MAG: filamentous hemagglutinin N-terminal domain-containing protein [Magnetococcus sp. MYC-9]